jgi:aminoglycoside phosphotransferase (APT) family kinase protein
MNDSRDILERACAIAGIDATGARLLRVGSNAVYRLAAPVIARVSRPGADADDMRRTVAVARWLQSAGYPAVRVVDVGQPVVAGGSVVTFWDAVSGDGDQYASLAEVAWVLVQLHRLTAPDDLHLPALSPFADARHRIESSTWLTPRDRAFLTAVLAQMRALYAGLEFTLPPGVVHGDASIGNVLRDDRGHPVVIDLDGFAVGPREWDVALTAIYYDSFGWHTREEYRDFARVYGYDIMTWAGYPPHRPELGSTCSSAACIFMHRCLREECPLLPHCGYVAG